MDKHIYGVDLDKDGRCIHYHTKRDVVALKCAKCNKYFACFKCHNKLMNHPFQSLSIHDSSPVMCGHCRHTLTYQQYKLGFCPYCHYEFNPKCFLHHSIYFE